MEAFVAGSMVDDEVKCDFIKGDVSYGIDPRQ